MISERISDGSFRETVHGTGDSCGFFYVIARRASRQNA